MPPTRRRNWGKLLYHPYARQGLNLVGRMARKAVNYGVNRYKLRHSKFTPRGYVTRQHDASSQYRRKRAPRKVRLRQRRKYKAFKKNLLRSLASRTAFINEAATPLIQDDSSQKQLWVDMCLNGFNNSNAGTHPYGYGDWEYICNRDYLMGDTAGDAQGRFSSGERRLIVDTSIMDVTIRNSSSTIVEELREGAPIELDLYEWVCYKKSSWEGNSGTFQFQLNTIQSGTSGRQGDPAQVLAYDVNTRGVSPFEFGVPLNKLGIKIVKKMKYFISSGDTITYQIRDTTNHEFKLADMINNISLVPKKARGIILVAKIVVGTPGYENNLCRTQLDVGMSRKYKYKILLSNGEKSGFYRDVAT